MQITIAPLFFFELGLCHIFGRFLEVFGSKLSIFHGRMSDLGGCRILGCTFREKTSVILQRVLSWRVSYYGGPYYRGYTVVLLVIQHISTDTDTEINTKSGINLTEWLYVKCFTYSI